PAFRLGEKASDPLEMYLADIYTVKARPPAFPEFSYRAGKPKPDCRSECKFSVPISASPAFSSLPAPLRKAADSPFESRFSHKESQMNEQSCQSGLPNRSIVIPKGTSCS